MTIQDQARIIARDTTRLIPQRIRQACQRIIINKATGEYISYNDMRVVRKVYQVHYAKSITCSV